MYIWYTVIQCARSRMTRMINFTRVVQNTNVLECGTHPNEDHDHDGKRIRAIFPSS